MYLWLLVSPKTFSTRSSQYQTARRGHSKYKKTMRNAIKFRIHQRRQKRIEEKKKQMNSDPYINRLIDVRFTSDRRKYIKYALKHAWDSYDKICFGKDELLPISRSCSDWLGAGLTVIDTLDTLKLMGFEDEFKKATDWVKQNLKFDSKSYVSFFETVIRVVGGLLSAYEFTEDIFFIDKAKEVADILDPVFHKKSGIPYTNIKPFNGQVDRRRTTCLADIGTFQLEYFSLSYHLQNSLYETKAQHIIDLLDNTKTKIPGLYPTWIKVENGKFIFSKISFGATGDSFYEYLLKLWLLTGKSNDQYKRMYVESTEAMITHMLKNVGGVFYLPPTTLEAGIQKITTMDHLTCFIPGMLALGSVSGILPHKSIESKHLQVAKDLCHTCYMAYNLTASGLGAEENTFSKSGIEPSASAYNLRPETIESIFYLWRITGDNMYREWGWNIFLALEKYCKLDLGYAGLGDVNMPFGFMLDKQESFFLSETLKYLWLLFQDPSHLLLAGIDDKNKTNKGPFYVFNTEAHPIKMWSTTKK